MVNTTTVCLNTYVIKPSAWIESVEQNYLLYSSVINSWLFGLKSYYIWHIFALKAPENYIISDKPSKLYKQRIWDWNCSSIHLLEVNKGDQQMRHLFKFRLVCTLSLTSTYTPCLQIHSMILHVLVLLFFSQFLFSFIGFISF